MVQSQPTPNNHFNETQVSELIGYLQTDWPSLACPSSNGTRLWSEEWEKHGTCSQSNLPQYNYFLQGLSLINSLEDIILLLQAEGIQADGKVYNSNSIIDLLKLAYGERSVGIECNRDASGNSQFYQVYVCIEPSGYRVIDCPVLPDSKCADSVVFPSF
ncbi:PREDICTED: extracellular ribonuclease LE-like [Fragaria vesca subsp. vesca]|uniref:extracellular ribonuclease LE-like n=1 Tax=Fragaria vesca subsp. vesca TaxID=101020 RepID=UPI0002C34EA2|nr:PREDICTED: extracellular ribonuclease LE-like [Fragaria vesca subsp. vesca]